MAKLKKAPVALIIMDGWGIGDPKDKSNAIQAARTPVLDGLGPVGAKDHSPEEFLLVESVVPRTALLAQLMMSIARVVAGRSESIRD